MSGVLVLEDSRESVRPCGDHIWVAEPPEVALAGQVITVGVWGGDDPSNPADDGSWDLQADDRCNSPLHFELGC